MKQTNRRLRLSRAKAERVAYVAALIAIETPLRKGKYSPTANVRWDLIRELRETLAAAGFDWEAARAEADTLASQGGDNG